jgi:two-component system, cell cycle response regulator
MEILIVDDDPVTCQILQASLTRAGHQVLEKTDGQSAWESLQDTPARFMVTDWMMPGMTGPELIQKVRGANFSTYTYIVILTARGDKTDVIDGLSAGADDYLIKPFNINELYARVNIGRRILDLEDRLTRAREQMEAMAMHDSLTQLLNRRAIYNHAEAEFNRAQRSMTPLSVLMIDIDRFKAVNDRYGHLSGDQALCHVARCISENIRSYDWVGRWGGDEFFVVLPSSDRDQALMVVQRIQTALASESLTLTDGSFISLAVSIGISHMESGGQQSLHTLIHQADEALYRVKKTGRDRMGSSYLEAGLPQ